MVPFFNLLSCFSGEASWQSTPLVYCPGATLTSPFAQGSQLAPSVSQNDLPDLKLTECTRIVGQMVTKIYEKVYGNWKNMFFWKCRTYFWWFLECFMILFDIFDPGLWILISERSILDQRKIQETRFWAPISNFNFFPKKIPKDHLSQSQCLGDWYSG